jgi:hypothetical protein
MRRATNGAEGEIMRTILATIVCSLLMALPLRADAVPPELVLKDVLQLTEAQVGGLQELAQAHRQAVESLMPQIYTAQEALQMTLQGSNPDATEVGRMVITIDALQRQIAQHQQDYARGFLALLTDAQRSQVQQIRTIEIALQAAAALHQLGL